MGSLTLRKKRGLSIRECCAALGIKKWDYSRKVRLDTSRFTVEELGLLADLFEAPPGWSFV